MGGTCVSSCRRKPKALDLALLPKLRGQSVELANNYSGEVKPEPGWDILVKKYSHPVPSSDPVHRAKGRDTIRSASVRR